MEESKAPEASSLPPSDSTENVNTTSQPLLPHSGREPRPLSISFLHPNLMEQQNIRDNSDTVRTKASVRSNLVLFEQDGTNRQSLASYLSQGMWEQEKSSGLSVRIPSNSGRNSVPASPVDPTVSSQSPQQDNSPDDGDDEDVDYLTDIEQPTSKPHHRPSAPTPSQGPLLGTLMGVYIPCCSNIMGVIVFVRLAWIVGQAGVGQAMLIAVLATVCTFLTTLSMSAIATNGRVAAGGAYYMISRSLGKELGGSVGILFCLANAVGCVMYILGVVEILTSYIVPGMSLGSSYTDARVYGTCLLILLGCIVLIGIAMVNRAAILFSTAVLIAILGALIGLLASNRTGLISGITGFPGNLNENLEPGYSKPDENKFVDSVNFFQLFGIFFPSVTGIMAGASRSGNLKDPQKSIPLGTISAQLTTSFIYYAFILLLGTVISGPLLRTKIPSSGLLVASVAWPSPWVTLIGCIFASLGAGLQCFVSAPRLIQAVSKDNIIPFLRPFSNLSKKPLLFGILPAGEPRAALLLTICLAEVVVLIGNLDAVASIVTMQVFSLSFNSRLYLITYLFINLSTALLGFLQSPNWRPSWRWYHWTVSMLAAIICLTYMFMISWISSLVAIAIMLGVYKYIEYRGAQVYWGDGLHALNLHMAQRNLYAAERIVKGDTLVQRAGLADESSRVKNWRPQIIGFTEIVQADDKDFKLKHPAFCDFMVQLKKAGGLTVLSSIVVSDIETASKEDRVNKYKRVLQEACTARKLEAFTHVLVSPSLKYGILSCTQSCGVGCLQPNTVMLGYPESWSGRNDVTACIRFVDVVKSIVYLDKVLLVLKGLKTFPKRKDRLQGTIDVYWIMNDGGVMTLLSYLLKKHAVWRKCQLRIFAIAQLNDNSVAMKENLVTSLKYLRIDAQAEVLELGDYDISEYAYERTIKVNERQDLMKKVQGTGNILAMPSAASSLSLFRQPSVTEHNDAQPQRRMRRLSVAIANRLRGKPEVKFANIPSESNTELLAQSSSTIPLQPIPSTSVPVDSLDQRAAMMNTSVKLNHLMQSHSGVTSGCQLILCNLPAPGKLPENAPDQVKQQHAFTYMHHLDTLTEGLDRVILVKGTGTEVITTYF